MYQLPREHPASLACACGERGALLGGAVGLGTLGSAPTPRASRNPTVWDQVGRRCQKQPHQERGLERFLFLMLRSLLCSYKILQDFVVSVRSPSTLCLRKQ